MISIHHCLVVITLAGVTLFSSRCSNIQDPAPTSHLTQPEYDERIVGAAPCLKDMGSYCLFEDDIVLDKHNEEDRDLITTLNAAYDDSGNATVHLAKAKSLCANVDTWPGRIVRYDIVGFNPSEVVILQEAMDSLSLACGVRWEPNKDFRYYRIAKTKLDAQTFGHSTLGYKLVNYCEINSSITVYSIDRGKIIHEFMHGLGFAHEHQRSDRPVTINRANISPDNFDDNFTTVSGSIYSSYDYESIMHYDSYAFSNNGLRTIDAGAFNSVIGQQNRISYRDKYGLRQAYGNPGVWGMTSYQSSATGYSVINWEHSRMGGRQAMEWLVGDIDGDGLTDLFQIWSESGTPYIAAYRSNGTGFSAISSSPLDRLGGVKWLVTDLNRDGKSDIVEIWENVYTPCASIALSDGTQFNKIPYCWLRDPWWAIDYFCEDVNNDRVPDLVKISNKSGTAYADIYTWDGSQFNFVSESKLGGSSAVQWIMADMDSDGDKDIIQIWDNGGKANVEVYKSDGTGFSIVPQSILNGIPAMAWLAEDVDNDGDVDLVQIWDNGGRAYVDVYTSNGSQFVLFSQNVLGGAPSLKWMMGDVDNDGYKDLIQAWNNGGRMNMDVYRWNNSGFSVLSGSPELGMVSSLGPLMFTGHINHDNRCDVLSIW